MHTYNNFYITIYIYQYIANIYTQEVFKKFTENADYEKLDSGIVVTSVK